MDNLIKILDEVTALTVDSDLFAYEIPLDKGGAWVSEASTESRFNDIGAQEFDIYYRGKDKTSCINNIRYLKRTIDGLLGSDGVCMLGDGTRFRLEMTQHWEYMEKDAEGYFLWASRLRLIAIESNSLSA